MKQIIIIVLTLLFAGSSVHGKTSEAILKRLDSLVKVEQLVELDMTMKIMGKKVQMYSFIQGEKTRIEIVGDSETWFDGETIWNYKVKDDEMVVTPKEMYDPKKKSEKNSANILLMFYGGLLTDYTYDAKPKESSDKKHWIIKLTPIKGLEDVYPTELTISKETNLVVSSVMSPATLIKLRSTINKWEISKEQKDIMFFQPDMSKYSSAEIITK